MEMDMDKEIMEYCLSIQNSTGTIASNTEKSTDFVNVIPSWGITQPDKRSTIMDRIMKPPHASKHNRHSTKRKTTDVLSKNSKKTQQIIDEENEALTTEPIAHSYDDCVEIIKHNCLQIIENNRHVQSNIEIIQQCTVKDERFIQGLLDHNSNYLANNNVLLEVIKTTVMLDDSLSHLIHEFALQTNTTHTGNNNIFLQQNHTRQQIAHNDVKGVENTSQRQGQHCR